MKAVEIKRLIAALLKSTKDLGEPSDTELETELLATLIGFVVDEAPQDEQNLSTVLELLNAMVVGDEYYEAGYVTAVDFLMEEKGEIEPDNRFVLMYQKFRDTHIADINRVAESCVTRIASLGAEETNLLCGEVFEYGCMPSN